jgi:hypothetical protein
MLEMWRRVIVEHTESFGFVTDKGRHIPMFTYFEDESIRASTLKRISKAQARAIAEARLCLSLIVAKPKSPRASERSLPGALCRSAPRFPRSSKAERSVCQTLVGGASPPLYTSINAMKASSPAGVLPFLIT